MVIIDQKAFNEDMSRYLERIKKTKPTSFKDRINVFKTVVDEEVPELSENQVHVEYQSPSVFRKLFKWKRRLKLDEVEDELTSEEKMKLETMESQIEAIEDEESELESMEGELEERKQGLLASMFNKMSFLKRFKHREVEEDLSENVLYEDKKPDFNEDIKEVLKITHTWLEKLPVRYKKMFKESDDFLKYKEILLKYGLVRVQGAIEDLKGPVDADLKQEVANEKEDSSRNVDKMKSTNSKKNSKK